MIVILKLIWSKVGGYLAAAGGAAAFVVGIFLYGKSAGRAAAENDVAKKNAKAIKQARGVENEIQSISDGDVDGRLDKWLRD